jgi:hypothetical protein
MRARALPRHSWVYRQQLYLGTEMARHWGLTARETKPRPLMILMLYLAIIVVVLVLVH